MILGINGKPWIDIESEVPPLDFERLHMEVSLGLAKGRTFSSPGNEFSRGDTPAALHDPEYLDCNIAYKNLPADVRKKVDSLPEHQRTTFMTVYAGAFYPWWLCYNCKTILNSSWMEKMNWKENKYKAEALSLFPYLIEWANSLPMFKGIGRLVILGLLPGHKAIYHRDQDVKRYKYYNEFVFVNPFKAKPLSVYDADTDTKYPIDARVAMFNDLDYHGSEPVKRFTYTIRVDGPFKPEWRKYSYGFDGKYIDD